MSRLVGFSTVAGRGMRAGAATSRGNRPGTASGAAPFPQNVAFALLAAADPQINGYAWQSFVGLSSGIGILWGNGDHQPTYGSAGTDAAAVRTFDPVTETLTQLHFPSGDTFGGTPRGHPVDNQDNLAYDEVDGCLFIAGHGVYNPAVNTGVPYFGWTHGNNIVNGADWPSGPYYSDFVANVDTGASFSTRKNAFHVSSAARQTAIFLSAGSPTTPDTLMKVITWSGSRSCKEVFLTGYTTPRGANRNFCALVGDFMYFGGGSTDGGNSTGGTDFWRLDITNPAAKSNGGSTDAGALVARATIPFTVGGSAGWAQLTHDTVHNVLVAADPSGVWLYDIATDQWSGQIVPSGYDMGTKYVAGFYGNGGHYYRIDDTTGQIRRLRLS